MKRLLASLLLVLMAVVLVLTASCGPGGEAAKTYKLGFLGPLTGPAASWILPIHRGMDKAMEEINEAGGIVVGGETYMLELAAADDRYSPEASVTAVQKLIFDVKVDYILGPFGPTCGSAVRPITEENGVVIFVITPAGVAFPIGPEYPYTFAFGDPMEFRINCNYQWLGESHPEVKTVAFIGQHGPGAEETTSYVREAAEAQGIEVVATEFYESGTVDFVPHLTKMLAENPDLIDSSGSSAALAGLIAKQARQMGYQGVFAGAPIPNAAVLMAAAGVENVEGFISAGTARAEKGTPEQRACYEWYIEKYEVETWGGGVMWGSDWVYWMAQVFEEVDSFDPDVVVPALEASEFEGLLGKMWYVGAEEWGIAHQKLVSPIYVVVFQNGEWEPVASIEVTED